MTFVWLLAKASMNREGKNSMGGFSRAEIAIAVAKEVDWR
jgi:hypothetical protein